MPRFLQEFFILKIDAAVIIVRLIENGWPLRYDYGPITAFVEYGP